MVASRAGHACGVTYTVLRCVSFAQVASVGPDVKNCAKNFPRAILCAAGMHSLINGTLHMVAAGGTDPALYPEWTPGYLRLTNHI